MLRTAAVVRLLLHNAVRVDEACAVVIADLGENCSHRVVCRGARNAKIPPTAATVKPALWQAFRQSRSARRG